MSEFLRGFASGVAFTGFSIAGIAALWAFINPFLDRRDDRRNIEPRPKHRQGRDLH